MKVKSSYIYENCFFLYINIKLRKCYNNLIQLTSMIIFKVLIFFIFFIKVKSSYLNEKYVYNRRFTRTLNNKWSRWKKQRHGLPQGSMLAPTLFNLYTNDQPIPENTSYMRMILQLQPRIYLLRKYKINLREL